MAQPNGTKGVGPCPYCGQRYVLNNWMRRSGDKAVRAADGRWLTNTHLIACYRKSTPTREPTDHDR